MSKSGVFATVTKLRNKNAFGVIGKSNCESWVFYRSTEVNGSGQWMLGLSTASLNIHSKFHRGNKFFWRCSVTWASCSTRSFSLASLYASVFIQNLMKSLSFQLVGFTFSSSSLSTSFSFPFKSEASLTFGSFDVLCISVLNDFGIGSFIE